jgi:hypothetical protein
MQVTLIDSEGSFHFGREKFVEAKHLGLNLLSFDILYFECSGAGWLTGRLLYT